MTLYRDGRPLLIDVGVETYSKKTFSPQRYEIWTMQSGWHNLPQFDPDGAKYDQQPGAAFAAADVTVTDALDGLAMDLAPAYGSVPGLGRYRRSVHLTDTGLTLRDETDYPGTVALTLMSAEKPAVDGDTVAFGALAAAAVTGADKIATEAVPIADPRLRQAWPDTLYRTRIYFTQQLSPCDRIKWRQNKMELIKLKLLDTDGMTLLTAPAAGQVSLVYMNAYKPGDRVSLEIGTPGQYVVIQFEDTMAPALVYVVKREINFHIPFGEQAITYSPKSFAGACHIIRARFAHPGGDRRAPQPGLQPLMTSTATPASSPMPMPTLRPAARLSLRPATPSTAFTRTTPTASGPTRAGASTATPTPHSRWTLAARSASTSCA